MAQPYLAAQANRKPVLSHRSCSQQAEVGSGRNKPIDGIAFSRYLKAMNRIPWDKILNLTAFDVVKLLLTAVIILIVTKIQLVSDRLSAVLIALPLTSLLAMIWMHGGGQSPQRIANHAEGTFWFVLPTLPMFLILPWMLRHQWNFWLALLANCLITAALFWIMVVVLRRFGIDLMPK
jgi:hypothetical protein